VNGAKSVLAVGSLAPGSLDRLREAGLRVEALPHEGDAEIEVVVDGCEGLIVAPGVMVTSRVLDAGCALEVVGRAGADVGGIDVDAATRRGIVVVHAPDAGLVSEAEHALALVLAVARDLRGADAALRRSDAEWSPGDGVEVRGKTLGLFGVRQSSPLLAERARALGMVVLACEAQSGMAAPDAGILECVTPEEILARADVLVLQTPAAGTPVFGVAELAGVREGARLVSPCTAGAVDAAALAQALAGGRLAGAAVVVEPGDVPAALLAAPRVVLTSAADADSADARRRAAVSVAEQVAAVLQGHLLRGAVNVASASGDDADELMPFMGLCSQLGRLLVQLAGEPVSDVEITYGGSVAYYDTRLLTAGVLAGVLAGRTQTPVNFVNAELVAAELGVTCTEARDSGIPDFPRLITVAVAGSGAAMSVSGTSLGSQHKPRLVRVFGEDVDVEPASHMAVLRYVDAAGIGGKVGTLLGEWDVNIGHMSVGRGKLGAEAVMVLTLDDSLTRAQAEELAVRCGLEYARPVEL
jgi:D-3-phosphoglycerate dehydrogenase